MAKLKEFEVLLCVTTERIVRVKAKDAEDAEARVMDGKGDVEEENEGDVEVVEVNEIEE